MDPYSSPSGPAGNRQSLQRQAKAAIDLLAKSADDHMALGEISIAADNEAARIYLLTEARRLSDQNARSIRELRESDFPEIKTAKQKAPESRARLRNR